MAENLVFLPDSPYTDWIINRSDTMFPGLNRFVVVVESKGKPNRFKCSDVILLENQELEKGLGGLDLKSFRRIIVNYHTPFIAHFLTRIRPNLKEVKLIWVIWSGDLYKHPSFFSKAYTETTQSLIFTPSFFRKLQGNLHHRLLQAAGKPNKFTFEKSFGLFDHVASVFEKDVLEAQAVLKVRASWIKFALLSLEEMFSEEYFNAQPILGNKVMVGHSGAPENNHLDILGQLGSLFPENEISIISPLSYGNPQYIAAVKSFGIQNFGDRFESLQDFLPREQYYRKLTEVSHALFNHRIQQAFGNILGLIFMGVKVFLNSDNPIFLELKKHDIYVFELEELSRDDIINPLSDDHKSWNRTKIQALFNEEKIQNYYRDLYTA